MNASPRKKQKVEKVQVIPSSTVVSTGSRFSFAAPAVDLIQQAKNAKEVALSTKDKSSETVSTVYEFAGEKVE